MKSPLQLPPRWAESQAAMLSSDVYLPKSQLQTKYPTAIIREAGCDRFMVLKMQNAECKMQNEKSALSTLHSPLSTIFVAFMGTHDKASLMSDLKVKRRAIGNGEEVHSGFDQGVEELWTELLAAIRHFDDGNCALIGTGHSRGASQVEDAMKRIAELRIAELTPHPGPLPARAEREQNKKEDWTPHPGPLPARAEREQNKKEDWTPHPGPLPRAERGNIFPPILWVLPVAPARIGNARYRNAYNAALGDRTFFYHHGADIVPWLPPYYPLPRFWDGNRHVGHRIWFPDPVKMQNAECRIQNAGRIVNPSLGRLALNLAALLKRQGLEGLENLLDDHHVNTYLKLMA